MKQVVVSLSGGMDSTALVGNLMNDGYQIIPVFFHYGSKHNVYEYAAALNVADWYGFELLKINLEESFQHFKSNLLQSGGQIPEGHYASDNMKLTVVPGRNLIFISILAGIAASMEISNIAIGVHSGDHTIYHDCRPNFIESAARTIQFATAGVVKNLITPFLSVDKTIIIKEAMKQAENGRVVVPFHLTRTCYKDQELSCGKCGSCNERLEAFKNNGIVDPITYQD